MKFCLEVKKKKNLNYIRIRYSQRKKKPVGLCLYCDTRMMLWKNRQVMEQRWERGVPDEKFKLILNFLRNSVPWIIFNWDWFIFFVIHRCGLMSGSCVWLMCIHIHTAIQRVVELKLISVEELFRGCWGDAISI